MALTWKMKRGDTAPNLRAQLVRGGVPVDLTGATVKFCLLGTKRDCTIINATNGEVEYSWQVGDTESTGTLQAEFEVTYSDGKIETFPNDDFIQIVVLGDIA